MNTSGWIIILKKLKKKSEILLFEYPVSMLTLAQRRQWVARLAFGWSWFYNVEPTLGQRILSMLSENVWNTLVRYVGPTLGQCVKSALP